MTNRILRSGVLRRQMDEIGATSITVAILAQGTSWADALAQAFLWGDASSIPGARVILCVSCMGDWVDLHGVDAVGHVFPMPPPLDKSTSKVWLSLLAARTKEPKK